ncbi:MAG: hypothetical protein Q9167_002950 [Letrouitia subvulpina]
MFSIPSAQSLRHANTYSYRTPPVLHTSRSYSTVRPFIYTRDYTKIPFGFAGTVQKRSLFGIGSSQNLLAHMEQTANNNPTSATAQNAFYSALLRANMPNIVVERFQTGRYASNTACETTYLRALEVVGQSEGMSGGSVGQVQQKGHNLSQEQLQAAAQAIAAQSRGGNISFPSSKSGSSGSGAKESPLYVVVDESTGSQIFKWIKFVAYFAMIGYFILAFLHLAVETSGVLKKVGGVHNTEAQPQDQTVRFSDVQGCDEAKEELQEVVEFLKDPKKFSSLGGKLPKGILLVGPPGTGKTLLARAVAGESGVPFFYMSGAEFDEIYVGVGAKRMRELFGNARNKAPAIIFIDELDAIGAKRNERDPTYVKQSLNQLLTEMDGFKQDTGIIVIAATNLPGILDKALTRPGRFDRNINVPLPDVRGRAKILKHHMRNIQIGTDVDETTIARGTPGFSGAELENLVNQAAVHASRNKQKKVSMLDLEWAKDKIMMGAERRSLIMPEKEKLLTAYHEGGHALVALFTKASMPLYKVTIMPRGQALGITHQLPELDKYSKAKTEFLADIDVSMGGKAAEELVFGPDYVTSGASQDITNATSVAYHMVAQCGMSDALGNIDLAGSNRYISSGTLEKVEDEVKRIIEEGRQRATKLLTEHREELDILAKALLEYEVLSLDEIKKVLKGEKLQKLSVTPNIPLKVPELVLPSPPTLPDGAPAASAGNSPSSGEDGEARL